MDINLVKSTGFAGDIEIANNFGAVVLHCWADGDILIMDCDQEIPLLNSTLTATGYVFRSARPDDKGPFVFEGKHYSLLDIEDFVLWDDMAAVEQTYHTVLAKAREEG
jgi:hypothetical protein